MHIKENPGHPDIRIGTLIKAEQNAADTIRELLPHGFESFSLVFRRTTAGVELNRLAEEVNEALGDSGAVISSLAIFGNALETTEEDIATLRGIEECIENAHLFGCDIVAGFTGRLRGKSIDESIPRFKDVWTPLTHLAEEKNIRIAFENCAMGGSWAEGDFNIAHNPLAWEMMFEALPSDNLGLQWEPCHQMLCLIDPIPQIGNWGHRFFNIHGKDANIHWDVIKKYGIDRTIPRDKALPTECDRIPQFAHHRTPGYGDSNWTEIISALRNEGFSGSIDIEGWHDPVMRDDREIEGQVAALNYLKSCRKLAD